MRKIFSWVFMIASAIVFVYDIVWVIDGSMQVRQNLDRIAAGYGSGVDYLGSGLDIYVFGTMLITLLGLIFSIVSIALSPNRMMKIISIVLACLFVMVPGPVGILMLSL